MKIKVIYIGRGVRPNVSPPQDEEVDPSKTLKKFANPMGGRRNYVSMDGMKTAFQQDKSFTENGIKAGDTIKVCSMLE